MATATDPKQAALEAIQDALQGILKQLIALNVTIAKTPLAVTGSIQVKQ